MRRRPDFLLIVTICALAGLAVGGMIEGILGW
jgi:hypothetical protein